MSKYATAQDTEEGATVFHKGAGRMIAFDSRSKAFEVCDALNKAYDDGQKDAFNLIRRLLGMKLHD